MYVQQLKDLYSSGKKICPKWDSEEISNMFLYLINQIYQLLSISSLKSMGNVVLCGRG